MALDINIEFITDKESALLVLEKINNVILEANNFKKHINNTDLLNSDTDHIVEKIKYDETRNLKVFLEELSNNVSKIPIVAASNLNATLHTIDMSKSKQYTLNVVNGTTTLSFGFNNCQDFINTVIIRVNNLANNSVINSIVFNGNWIWSEGNPILGVPKNKSFELIVRNVSTTQVKGYTDFE